MTKSPSQSRKQFLSALGSVLGGAVFGCSSDPSDGTAGFFPAMAGGGQAGTGGGAGGQLAGGAGGQGTAGSATGGTQAGGAGGDVGAAGQAQGGGGGASNGGAGGQANGGADTGGAGGEVSYPDPDCNLTVNVTITRDHDHALDITLEDILAAAPKSYNTQGGSPHPHWIEFTAQDFMDLQAGMVVRKRSCNDGHEHEYIVSCSEAPHEESMGIFDICFEEPGFECGAEDGDFCAPIE